MGLGLFLDGGWNTISVKFSLSHRTKIGTQFTVKINVGASYVMDQSIDHNLPSFQGTSQSRCLYNKPLIICEPIDAWTELNNTYHVSFKAHILSTDIITNLGSITITPYQSNQQLFTPFLQNQTIPTVVWTDYHDYTGFHDGSLNLK